MYHVLVVPGLDMPIGKYLAQVAHGAVQLLIDRFEVKGDELVLTDPEAIAWLKNWTNNDYQIELGELDKAKLESGEYDEIGSIAPIHDLGRTVFNGKLTLTVAGYSPVLLPKHSFNVENPSIENEMRQIFLVNQKNPSSEDRDELAKEIAALSIASIMKHSRFYEDKVVIKVTDDLKEWLYANAAKIVLRSKTENPANRAMKAAQDEDISVLGTIEGENGLLAMVFGPDRKESIDKVTRRFRLL